jgi:hypothetical protein
MEKMIVKLQFRLIIHSFNTKDLRSLLNNSNTEKQRVAEQIKESIHLEHIQNLHASIDDKLDSLLNLLQRNQTLISRQAL